MTGICWNLQVGGMTGVNDLTLKAHLILKGINTPFPLPCLVRGPPSNLVYGKTG